MTSTLTLGIDPGSKGGAVLLDQDHKIHVTLKRHGNDPAVIAKFLRDLPVVRLAALEKVHSMPRDGGAAAFEFGRGYGLWVMGLTTFHIPFLLVGPKVWQAGACLSFPTKESGAGLDAKAAESLRRRNKTAHKDAIVAQAKRRWPELALLITNKAEDGGLADAAYLALHALMVFQGIPIPRETRAREAG